MVIAPRSTYHNDQLSLSVLRIRCLKFQFHFGLKLYCFVDVRVGQEEMLQMNLIVVTQNVWFALDNSTVSKIYNKCVLTGSVVNLPKSGRRRVSNDIKEVVELLRARWVGPRGVIRNE